LYFLKIDTYPEEGKEKKWWWGILWNVEREATIREGIEESVRV
jgi:hypothetical protein